jgi:hypothetical protein
MSAAKKQENYKWFAQIKDFLKCPFRPLCPYRPLRFMLSDTPQNKAGF